MIFGQIIAIFACISLSKQYGKIDGIEKVTIYNDLSMPVEVVGEANYCMYSQDFRSAVHIAKNARATFYANTTNGGEGYNINTGYESAGFDGVVWLLQDTDDCYERTTGSIQIYRIKALYNGKSIMECRMRVYIYWWEQVRFCETTGCSTYSKELKVGMHARVSSQWCRYGTYDKPDTDVYEIHVVHY